MEKDTEFELGGFLPYLLNQAAEECSLAFQRIYKSRYGMLRTDWRVLFHVGRFGPITAREIGIRAKVHKTKVSRAVQRLEEMRFLKRTRDEADRRVEWLDLTGPGEAAYRDLRAEAEAYDARLAARFAPEDMHRLRAMLADLAGPPKG